MSPHRVHFSRSSWNEWDEVTPRNEYASHEFIHESLVSCELIPEQRDQLYWLVHTGEKTGRQTNPKSHFESTASAINGLQRRVTGNPPQLEFDYDRGMEGTDRDRAVALADFYQNYKSYDYFSEKVDDYAEGALLSQREAEYCLLRECGLTEREMVRLLDVSLGTVKKYGHRARQKVEQAEQTTERFVV